MQGLDNVEAAGSVGDCEHGEGIVEVAGSAAAVYRQELSLELVHNWENVTSERVPLHGAPLPKQI